MSLPSHSGSTLQHQEILVGSKDGENHVMGV